MGLDTVRNEQIDGDGDRGRDGEQTETEKTQWRGQ